MNLFDAKLKNGMLFVGEYGIINIIKGDTRSFLRLDGLDGYPYYPFLENIYASMDIQNIDYLYSGMTYKSDLLYFCAKLKKKYKELTDTDILNLSQEDFIIDIVNSSPREFKDCFILSFNKEQIRKEFNISRISKKTLKNSFSKIVLDIITKAIWNDKGFNYNLSYYKFSDKNSKTIVSTSTEKNFYGPTMNINGIQKYLKENFNEQYLKLISSKTKEYKISNIRDLWKEISISPNTLKEKIPEISIKNYKELIELNLESETELFSKANFEVEIMFCNKGLMGKKIQTLIKNRILNYLKTC